MSILHTSTTLRHHLIKSLTLAVSLGLSLSTAVAETGDPTVVETRQGLVKGVSENGLVIFKGIPYAAPPVGQLRWKPTQPAIAWEGVRDAAEFAAPCHVVDTRSTDGKKLKEGGADLFIGVPLAQGGSEDCLHLNVWAPASAEKAAVMVWIQPAGPASMPLYDGSAFARDGVVFVSLDYRQLTLGNFAHPALTAESGSDEPLSRFQTMDQLAALRWINDNIKQFGGDASNVTVFGLSAGAASVLQLLTIPEAKGLIAKAIVQSGVGWWGPVSLGQMEQLGSAFASYAGLPGKEATAEQLRELPVDRLPQIGVYNVDGRMEQGNATVAIDEGRMLDVPLMIGSTTLDGSSLRHTTPEAIVNNASPELLAAYASDQLTSNDLGTQMYTDAHVAAPARWIAGKAASGAPSYLYQYSYVLSMQQGKTRGATHGSELPFVFDIWSKAMPQLPLSDDDRKVTKLMHSCWVSFAKTGTPECEGAPAWPAYTTENDQVMELGKTSQVHEHLRKTQLDAQEQAWRSGSLGGLDEGRFTDATLQNFQQLLLPR